MKWKYWLYGLGAATIGGAATAIGGALGASFAGVDVLTLAFWKIVVGAAVGGGLMNAVAYLKRSPLPSVLAGVPEQSGSSALAPADNPIRLPPVSDCNGPPAGNRP